jgi:hypothetical protein
MVVLLVGCAIFVGTIEARGCCSGIGAKSNARVV